MNTDEGEGPPDLVDLVDELRDLAEAAGSEETRTWVEETIETAMAVRQPGVFRRVSRGFDRADAASFGLVTAWGRVDWTEPAVAFAQVAVAFAGWSSGPRWATPARRAAGRRSNGGRFDDPRSASDGRTARADERQRLKAATREEFT